MERADVSAETVVVRRIVEQIHAPNFRVDGRLFLVRCPYCKRENHGPAVASGQCAWCGWNETDAAITRSKQEEGGGSET